MLCGPGDLQNCGGQGRLLRDDEKQNRTFFLLLDVLGIRPS